MRPSSIMADIEALVKIYSFENDVIISKSLILISVSIARWPYGCSLKNLISLLKKYLMKWLGNVNDLEFTLTVETRTITPYRKIHTFTY